MSNPWADQQQQAAELAQSTIPVLQDVRLRFGVSLSDLNHANAFAHHFRMTFSRATTTVDEDSCTVWIIFRCGAVDGRDATVQSAVAIETIARHHLVRQQPRNTHFHDVALLGPIPADKLERAVKERDDAMHKAALWGMLNRLVPGFEPAAITSQSAPPQRPTVPASRQITGDRLPSRRVA